MAQTFHTHTLDNGLRVAIEVMPHVRSAAAGFLARTGARDETRDVAGVSHFLEHMCFKGTPNRTWEQINIEFDDVGSSYTACSLATCRPPIPNSIHPRRKLNGVTTTPPRRP